MPPPDLIATLGATLRNVDDLSPTEIRARAIGAVQRAAESPHAGYYDIRELDGELRAAALLSTHPHQMSSLHANLLANRWPTPWFDPRRPPPRHARGFTPWLATRPEPAVAASMWRRIYGSMCATDQIKLLAYDGPRYLGWVRILWSGMKPRDSARLRG